MKITSIDVATLELKTEPLERGDYEGREDFFLRILQRKNKIIEKYKPVIVDIDDVKNPKHAKLIYLVEKNKASP